MGLMARIETRHNTAKIDEDVILVGDADALRGEFEDELTEAGILHHGDQEALLDMLADRLVEKLAARMAEEK